jgi:hypothetical protein
MSVNYQHGKKYLCAYTEEFLNVNGVEYASTTRLWWFISVKDIYRGIELNQAWKALHEYSTHIFLDAFFEVFPVPSSFVVVY